MDVTAPRDERRLQLGCLDDLDSTNTRTTGTHGTAVHTHRRGVGAPNSRTLPDAWACPWPITSRVLNPI